MNPGLQIMNLAYAIDRGLGHHDNRIHAMNRLSHDLWAIMDDDDNQVALPPQEAE